MNPLELYTEVCDRSLTPAEAEELKLLADRYPYFAVLHFIRAKHASVSNDPQAESLRTLAAVFAPDRKRLANYLSEGHTPYVPSEVIPVSVSISEQNPKAKPEPEVTPIASAPVNFAPAEHIPEGSPMPAAKEPEIIPFDPGMNWKLNTLVKILLERTRYLIETVPLEIQTYISAKVGADAQLYEAVPPPSPALEILKNTIEHNYDNDLSAGETVSTTTIPEPPATISPVIERTVEPKIKAETLENRTRNLEDEIKARLARAKEMLSAGEKTALASGIELPSGPVVPTPPAALPNLPKVERSTQSPIVTREEDLIEPESENVITQPEPQLETGPISDNVLFTDSDAFSPIDPAAGVKLTSGFLERFVFPKFDAKPETLYAYRVFLEPGDGISISDIEAEEQVGFEAGIPAEPERKVEHTGFKRPDEQKQLIERAMRQVTNENAETPYESPVTSRRPEKIRSKFEANPEIVAEYGSFSGDYQVPTDPMTGFIEKTATSSFSRFIAPVFDEKPITLYAYRTFLDPATQDIIPEPPEKITTESFSRFIVPIFDPKSPTLSVREYRVSDVLNMPHADETHEDHVPFRSGLERFQNDGSRFEILSPYLAQAALLERKITAEITESERKNYIPIQLERITSTTFRRFRSLDNEKSYQQEIVENQPIEALPVDASIPRMRTDSMRRFVEPEFIDLRKDNPVDLVSEEVPFGAALPDEIAPVSETPSLPPVEAHHADIQPAEAQPAPADELPGRLRSESMSRFVEPDFSGGMKKQLTYASKEGLADEMLGKSEKSNPSEEKQTETVALPVSETMPGEIRAEIPGAGERIFNEPMARFVEPDFVNQLKQMTYTAAENPLGILENQTKMPVAEKTEIKEENPVHSETTGGRIRNESMERFIEPDFGTEKMVLESERPTPALPGTAPEAEVSTSFAIPDALKNMMGGKVSLPESEVTEPIRTESMNRFVQPEFDPKPETLYVDKTPVPDAPAPQVIEPVPMRTESMERFIEPEFDPKPETLYVDKTPVPDAPAPAEPEPVPMRTESMERFVEPSFDPKPETLYVDKTPVPDAPAPAAQPAAEKVVLPTPEIRETVIRYPRKGRQLEIKLRPDQLKMFSVDVSELSARLQSEYSETPEPAALFSPELIEQEFFASLEGQNTENLNLDKVIIDYSKKVIEFMVEDAAPQPEPEPEIRYIEKIVEVQVPVDRIVEKIVEVEKLVEVEKRVEIEVPVDRIVEVEKVVEVEKRVEVEVPVDRIVEVEKVVEVEKRIEVEVPVDRIVEVEKVVEVEVPVDRIVEVEKVVEIEKRVEVPVEKIVEKIIEVERSAAQTEDVPIFAVEPVQIRNLVLDYNLFLEQALAIKETFSENEAERLFRLIHERMETFSPEMIYKTFSISPPALPAGGSSWQGSSGEYQYEETQIDERISRFRTNLARIRNKSLGEAPAVTLSTIQDRFIESIISTMTRPAIEGEGFSLDDFLKSEGTLEPEGNSPIDSVIEKYRKLENRIHSQTAKMPSGSVFEDFQIEPQEDEQQRLPTTAASETLAQIFASQGKNEEAIKIYRKLILKKPDKKAYFEAQIESLKQDY